jgi:hypothetical protein
MNAYKNISSELREFFSNHAIFKILLPLDMILLFLGLAVIILSEVFGINLGGLINSLAYWIFILGLLLTYANMKEYFLYIGFFGYSAVCLIEIIKALVRSGHYFSWSLLFSTIIFGGLGYLVFKHTVTGSSGKVNLKH